MDVRSVDVAGIFDQVTLILDQDPKIDELGLIVSADPDHLFPDSNDNMVVVRTPEGPAFILKEHKLGLSYWCISALYAQAKAVFVASLAEYKTSPSAPAPSVVERILASTRVIVCMTADNYTAWNARKTLILALQAPLDREMGLLDLVFSKHTKSPEAWAHRRWAVALIEERLGSDAESAAVYRGRYTRELAICKRTAELYKKNYYSWTHRLWVLPRVGLSVLFEQLREMDRFTRLNVSDNSGFHYRCALLTHICSRVLAGMSSEGHRAAAQAWPAFLNAKCAVPSNGETEDEVANAEVETLLYARLSSKKTLPDGVRTDAARLELVWALWEGEVVLCKDLSADYPGHEAVWMHMRAVWPHLASTAGAHALAVGGVAAAAGVVGGLCEREEGYAAECSADRLLANHAEVRRCAAGYTLWLAHTVRRLETIPKVAAVWSEAVAWAVRVLSRAPEPGVDPRYVHVGAALSGR